MSHAPRASPRQPRVGVASRWTSGVSRGHPHSAEPAGPGVSPAVLKVIWKTICQSRKWGQGHDHLFFQPSTWEAREHVFLQNPSIGSELRADGPPLPFLQPCHSFQLSGPVRAWLRKSRRRPHSGERPGTKGFVPPQPPHSSWGWVLLNGREEAVTLRSRQVAPPSVRF